MEIYRYIVDDFLIEFCKNLKKQKFILKNENLTRNKQGKRQYLNKKKTTELLNRLELHFQSKIDIPRIKHGNKQTVDTLIIEEALLLARLLRKEKTKWVPRIVYIS